MNIAAYLIVPMPKPTPPDCGLISLAMSGLLRHGFLLGESIAAVIGPGFPLSPSIPVTVGCRTTRLDLALFLEGGGFCHGPAGSCPQRVIEGLKQLSKLGSETHSCSEAGALSSCHHVDFQG